MRSATAKVRINFDIQRWFNARIVRCARFKGWTKSEFIRRAIEDAIEKTTPAIPVDFKANAYREPSHALAIAATGTAGERGTPPGYVLCKVDGCKTYRHPRRDSGMCWSHYALSGGYVVPEAIENRPDWPSAPRPTAGRDAVTGARKRWAVVFGVKGREARWVCGPRGQIGWTYSATEARYVARLMGGRVVDAVDFVARLKVSPLDDGMNNLGGNLTPAASLKVTEPGR